MDSGQPAFHSAPFLALESNLGSHAHMRLSAAPSQPGQQPCRPAPTLALSALPSSLPLPSFMTSGSSASPTAWLCRRQCSAMVCTTCGREGEGGRWGQRCSAWQLGGWAA